MPEKKQWVSHTIKMRRTSTGMDDERYQTYLNRPPPVPITLMDVPTEQQMNDTNSNRYQYSTQPRTLNPNRQQPIHADIHNNDEMSTDSSIERSRNQFLTSKRIEEGHSNEEQTLSTHMTSRGSTWEHKGELSNVNNMPPPDYVVRNDNSVVIRGNVSKVEGKSHVNKTPILATTFFHVAEIPCRKLPTKREFYLSLLGMPNATDAQVEKKKKTIEGYKMKANRWGRDYLQNEYVSITNLIAASYGIEEVQNFREIKRAFVQMDCANQKNIEAMKEIQYSQWMAPHMRSMWKTGMEATFMSQFNYVYKEKTMEEESYYKYGCFAKLFTQIKVDLNKQLQECGTRVNITSSDSLERVYVKRRNNNGKSTSVNKRAYTQVSQMTHSDNVSEMGCSRSDRSDLVVAQNRINLLQQELNDMKRQVTNGGVGLLGNTVSYGTRLYGLQYFLTKYIYSHVLRY
jgi:hypothetical protein